MPNSLSSFYPKQVQKTISPKKKIIGITSVQNELIEKTASISCSFISSRKKALDKMRDLSSCQTGMANVVF